MTRHLMPLVAAAFMLLAASACSGGDGKRNADSAATSQRVEQTPHADEFISAPGRPAVVDFYADWCPPCRQLSPMIDSLRSEYGDKVDFVKVNVDDNADVAGRYGISSIPTLLFLKGDGEISATVVGLTSTEELHRQISEIIEE